MAQFETWLKSDLQQVPSVQVIHGNLFSADHKANRVGVIVTNNGADVTLSGTVDGFIVRADGATIPAKGSEFAGKSGNRAWINLPPSAYVIPGQISIVIRLTHNGHVTVLGACTGYVYRSTTDTVIDPGQVVPNIAQLMSIAADIEDTNVRAQEAVAELETGMADVIIVSGTQPTSEYNKVWLDDSNPQAVQIKFRAQDGSYYAPEMYTGERGPKGDTGDTGEEGTTFIPAVSEQGMISWTNNGDKENPQPVSIKGPKGDTGPAPEVSEEYSQYALTGSGSSIPDESAWGEPGIFPALVQGQFLWTRHTIEWDNGDTSVTYSVSYQGQDGTGTGTVTKVNNIGPDITGNVTLPGYVVDQTVTEGSTNAVSGGAVYDAIADIEQPDADSELSDESENAVQNKVIKAALDLKAPLASPALTGNPTAPTQSASTNNTRIATTAFVNRAVGNSNTRVLGITIAPGDWSTSSPATCTKSGYDGVDLYTAIRAYPTGTNSVNAIQTPIFIEPGNGSITFTTSIAPASSVSLNLHLEQAQTAAGTTCIVNRAGGGTTGASIDLINAIDTSESYAPKMNSVYKVGDYVAFGLDFTCDAVTTKTIGTLPSGYRPFNEITAYGTLINGSSATAPGAFIIRPTGQIRYNNWSQDTTLTGVSVSAVFDARTYAEDVLTFDWLLTPSQIPSSTEYTNVLTKDVVAGTLTIDYELEFGSATDISNFVLRIPSGFRPTRSSGDITIAAKYKATSSGSWTDLNVKIIRTSDPVDYPYIRYTSVLSATNFKIESVTIGLTS